MDTPALSEQAILASLDAQQRAVVAATDGPVLVVAGAGSGKTTTLVRRVAWLLARGVPPNAILLLTFTRAAAVSMLGRARSLAPEAAGVTGGTFHSVSAGVLRQLHEVFGLPERFTVLDPEDVEQAVKAIAAEIPFPDGRRPPRPATVAAVLSSSANTRTPIEVTVDRRAPEYADQPEWFERVKDAYTAYKLDRGLLDYDDLLVYLAVALGHPQVGEHLRARWRYVLVDEHQDSNALQLEIVYGLGSNVMAVGDPAQAIYGFRGSAPATMMDFVRHWPDARVLPLEVSYRSTQPILELVNAVDRAMAPRFERSLRACRPEPAPRPTLVTVRDEDAQAREICRRILAAREEGVELADQAVVVRAMWAARRLEGELMANRIPYRVVGGLRIDEAAHVKDLLSLARVVDNPRNEPAWGRVLGLLPGVGPAAARKVLAHLAAAPEVVPVERIQGAPWPRKVDPAPLVDALRSLASNGPVATRLRGAVAAFSPVFHAVYESEWRDRSRDLETVAAMAEDHDSLTTFLAAITLDYSLDGRERTQPTERPDERPLVLTTIHSAKGLEWHTVHIPSFVEGHLPTPYAVSEAEQQEELRVFYVAASRARRRLLFYRPGASEDGNVREPSRYEALIAPYVDRESGGKPKGPEAPSLAGVKLDMRSILLGKK